MAQSLKHKRSSVVTNGAPKLPTTDQIAVGEIAINFAEGYETLSTRNNNDGIATFSSDSVLDKKYISSGAVVSAMTELSGILEDDEYTIAQALNEQNDRIIAIEESGYITDAGVTTFNGSGGAITYAAPVTSVNGREGDVIVNEPLVVVVNGTYNSALNITDLTAVSGTFAEIKDAYLSGREVLLKYIEGDAVMGYAYNSTRDAISDDTTVGNFKFRMHPNNETVWTFSWNYNNSIILEWVGTGLGISVNGDPVGWYAPEVHEDSTDQEYRTIDIPVPTEASIANSGFTKNALTAYTETDPTVPAWAKQSTKPSYTASEVGAMATSERSNYLSTGATLDSVADGTTRKLSNYSLTSHTHSEYSSTGHSHTAAEVGALSTATTYFDDVEYDSNSKRINFKKNGSVIDYVDATDFIKDGMVSSVTVSNGNLVLTFNTDAGREDITLALTQIFNPNNYYDKTAADGKFLTGYTETDPTVPSWAKESTKPSYTASEVGAMATSERNNYLPTGTTLDNIADGTTRKLSNYSLTGHTHDNYSLTSHTHSQYASTAHTHTAAEVGALPTGTTLDNIADGSTRKLSNYSLTSHTHTAAEVGALPDTTDIPTQASIANSGFTKNTGTLTGVTINGSAATVSNGNASLTIELGGGSGSGLPAVTAADNGKILQVVDGQWQLVTPTVVYTGTDAPSNTLGNNGDIYLQTS